LGPVRRPQEGDNYLRDFDGLRELERAWNENKSLAFALDLVGSALVVGGSPSSSEAAQYVLDNAKQVSPLAIGISRQLLGSPTSSSQQILAEPATAELRNEIHDLRHRLGTDPRRTLIWTELARHYTIAGLPDKASSSMRVALALSPEHRYVLRAAARLAIHNGEFDSAHSIIARAARTRSDPWLVATELATAEVADRRPQLLRHAKRMLESDQFLPFATTELSSALATLDLRSGKDRAARRLFSQSLAAANENAIAQGEWASHHLRGIEIPDNQRAESPEASARASSEAGEWEQAVFACRRWLDDQPFSSGPAELGSYEASLGQDYATGVELARRGLRANPDEFLLRNNLVFCLINAGDLGRASDEFIRIDEATLDRQERATYLATAGLLAFRQGFPDIGHTNYIEAIRLLEGRRQKTVATILLARELLLSKQPEAPIAVQEAEEIGEQEADGHPDIALWLKHLQSLTARR
jgi:tetratricopeptide (TPR) repeat protein